MASPKGGYDHDVMVSVYNYRQGYKGKRICLSFRNGSEGLLMDGHPYIELELVGDKVYFHPARRNHGNKLCKKGNLSRMISASKALSEWAIDNMGYYSLRFDFERQLFYIGG